MKLKVTDLNSPDSRENDSDGSVRLQVYLAHAGVASRRASEQLIMEGRVTVNGSVATKLGTRVKESDEVLVDGNKVRPEEHKRYVLLNKPSGYVCSLVDEKGRKVAVDLLSAVYSERLYNIGRLDMYSAGAILFTNDGDFANKIGHPSAQIEKEYIIEASLPFRDEVLDAFTKGIRIDGVFYRALKAERMSSRRMHIVLIEGKNREIRRVLEHFDIRIKSLIRIRIGPVELGSLKYGEFRNLTRSEIDTLLNTGNQ